jgi:hypothetical protein
MANLVIFELLDQILQFLAITMTFFNDFVAFLLHALNAIALPLLAAIVLLANFPLLLPAIADLINQNLELVQNQIRHPLPAYLMVALQLESEEVPESFHIGFELDNLGIDRVLLCQNPLGHSRHLGIEAFMLGQQPSMKPDQNARYATTATITLMIRSSWIVPGVHPSYEEYSTHSSFYSPLPRSASYLMSTASYSAP